MRLVQNPTRSLSFRSFSELLPANSSEKSYNNRAILPCDTPILVYCFDFSPTYLKSLRTCTTDLFITDQIIFVMASKAPVNVPVNQQIKERDVNNKLQLYGIYSGALFIPHPLMLS